MSIISQISRIEDAANVIKAKTVALGLEKTPGTTVLSTDKIESHASAINSIVAQSVSTSRLTADTTAVTISKGYYGSDATVSVTKMSAPTVALSTSSQTISCDDKMMDGNITIPAANGFYTGQTSPSSTLGNDGDLYLVTQ